MDGFNDLNNDTIQEENLYGNSDLNRLRNSFENSANELNRIFERQRENRKNRILSHRRYILNKYIDNPETLTQNQTYEILKREYDIQGERRQIALRTTIVGLYLLEECSYVYLALNSPETMSYLSKINMTTEALIIAGVVTVPAVINLLFYKLGKDFIKTNEKKNDQLNYTASIEICNQELGENENVRTR